MCKPAEREQEAQKQAENKNGFNYAQHMNI